MKIDRHIPIPAEPVKPKKDRIPVENMEIGDSVLISGMTRRAAMATVRGTALSAALPFNFKSAVDGDGIRVWRIA